MDNLENRRLDMFRRVRDFGASRTADFSAGTLGNELFTIITTVTGELETLGASQSSGLSRVTEGTASKSVIRAGLYDDLVAINRTARALAYETPGLDNKFRLPRKGNDQALLNSARAFAADAAPLAAAFVRHELPADFLTALNARIAEFEAVVNQRNGARETHVAATAAIDNAIERGMDTVNRLDAIVRNKYRNDVAVLAAWETASHTERAGRSTVSNRGEQPTPDQG